MIKLSIFIDLDDGSHIVEFLHENVHLLINVQLIKTGVVETSTEHHICRRSHER